MVTSLLSGMDNQVRGMGWAAFLREAPARVVEVIEDGPFPLKEYDGSKLTYPDKKKGMMRYKGGDGRGHIKMKTGMKAVVYFDPDFCEGKYRPIEVPDEVIERHSEPNVLAEFQKL